MVSSKAALWFWKKNGKISQAAQRGDITAVTKVVNGGTNGLSDRKSKFQKYLSKLQGGELKTDVAAPAVVAKQPSAAPAQSATQKASTALPPTIARPNSSPSVSPALSAAGTGIVERSIQNTTPHKAVPEGNLSRKPEPNGSVTQNLAKSSKATSSAPPKGNAPPWMQVALQELQRGVGENKDLARANQYFSDLGFPNYKANAQSWCAAFVSWCLKNSGTAYNQQNPLSAKGGYANWGKPLSKKDIPYGAIVVVGPSHAFFAAGVEGNMVRGLGGNQGKPGEVKYSNFPIDSIISVSWPPGASGQGSVSTTTQATPSQVAQQQNATSAAARQSDANAARLAEPRVSTSKTAAYQSAQQKSSAEVINAKDSEIPSLQLQEARAHTKLLTEIRDAVTGGRSDSNAMGEKHIGAMGNMTNAQVASVELIAGGIKALTTTLSEFRRNNKPETLSDQFPIGAKK